MTLPSIFRAKALLLGPFAAVALPVSASAAAEPHARLVDCGSGSCLLVTGYRADAASLIRINGHAVPAEGARKWRVRLPVETLRAWSAPFDRSITVSAGEASAEADLPIGLLGHVENLAMLVVSVK